MSAGKTESGNANEELNAEFNELEAILSSLTSVLIQVDDHLIIRRWNSAAEQALEVSAESAIGCPLAECGVQWDEEDLRRVIADISLGQSPQRLHLRFTDSTDIIRCLGVTLNPIKTASAENPGVLILARDITVSRAVDQMQRRLMTAVEQVDDTIVITDLCGKVVYVNPAFERVTGYTRKEVIGANPKLLNSGQHDAEFYKGLWETLNRGEVWSGHFKNKRKDGSIYEEDATISPVRNETGVVTNFVAVKKDVTERIALELQLLSAQKLESIGQLAAGIAHEINTPTQFISDNTRFLRDAFGKLGPLLQQCNELSKTAGEVSDPTSYLKNLAEVAAAAKIGFVSEEIPDAIDEALSGLTRVTEIVSAMKSFSHPGTAEKQSMDLNQIIGTTVTLSTNEWKYVAEIETELDPDLPLVSCLPGELGQVLLNVIVNAAHAIESADLKNEGHKGTIRIQTQRVDELVEIRISDTGTGIPKDVIARVFDPFFTTKEVGRGTGQGLAISRSVIIDKHAGTIDVSSEEGCGTTFIIRIPITDSKVDRFAQAEAA